jgi:hypothetical protein
MLAAKIIIIGILLMSVGNVYAWDEEGGLTEGEKYDIMFNSWSTYQDALHPKWYDPIADPIKEYLIKFESYFIYTPPDTEVLIMIKKWSYRDGAYHEEDIYWQDAKNLVWDTNRTEIPIVTVNPMEEFFKNNTEEIDNFTTVDDDPIHPDVLNVTVTVDTDGTLYDMTKSGYFTLDDDSLRGSIYEGINMYAGTGDETGMGKGFGWIFFGLIPIIFIFAILKFARRIVGD